MSEYLHFAGELRPHQDRTLGRLRHDSDPRVLAFDPGLGKTPTALAAVVELDQAGEFVHCGRNRLSRGLWVTSKALIEQTITEAKRFVPDIKVAGQDILESSNKNLRIRSEQFPDGFDLIVVSHQCMLSRRHYFDRHEFSVLIVDEASELKGGGSLAEAVRSVAVRTPHVLALTATVQENSPVDVWNVLNAVDAPDLWKRPQFDHEFVTWKNVFRNRFAKVPAREPVDWVQNRLNEARDYLSRVVVRETPESAGVSLPRRVGERVRLIELTPEQLALYESAGDDRAGFAKKEQAGLGAHGDSPLVAELLGELGRRNGQQAIVYCESLGILDQVAAALDLNGHSYARVEGKVSAPDRRSAVDRFWAGEAQVFLGSRVLERGLNLHCANLLISLGASWNWAREKQREGRVCRIGSAHDTYEHLYLLPNTSIVKAQLNRLDDKLLSAQSVGLA